MMRRIVFMCVFSMVFLLLGCSKTPERPVIDTRPIEVHNTYTACPHTVMKAPAICYNENDHLGGLTSVRKTKAYLDQYHDYTQALEEELACYLKQANSTEAQ